MKAADVCSDFPPQIVLWTDKLQLSIQTKMASVQWYCTHVTNLGEVFLWTIDSD